MPTQSSLPARLQSVQRQHIEHIFQLGEGLEVPQLPAQQTIRRSWLRCLNEYQLDPTQPRPARVVPQQILIEHRESVDELLHVARAGVDQLYQQIAQLGYVLLLTDHRGITVEFRGDPNQDQQLRKAGLYLGADWDERFAGTCAVGTCLHDRQAIICHRQEHFDASHISLTCTAAPIADPQGNVMAVLDISALQSPTQHESQNFSLSLVTLYARMIEDAYFLQRYRDCLMVRLDTSREFVHVNGRGLIAIEENGQVIAANAVGRDLISEHQRRWPPWSAHHTPMLGELFECEIADVLSINSATDDQLRAFRARVDNTIYFISLLEPRRPRPAQQAQPLASSLPEPLVRLGADDPAMRKVQKLAERLRNEASVNVLISGETGTGKEVVARALHDSGNRSKGPFIAVNCAAIPEALIESELFGYEPGAFTGGRAKGMRGLIPQAHGGTLFLDEIGDMPLALQTRLLRVLAEREVMPLGANKPEKVDIRVITATHRNIDSMIQQGEFREDLYYRLNGAQLRLPALRDRADKLYVIRRVFDDIIQERASSQSPRLRADAISALLAYAWPGNIRQLKNALAFALATSENEEITVHDLPEQCLSQRITRQATPLPADAGSDSDHTLLEMLKEQHWNISAVARALGVSRPTVYRQMQRQGIVPPNWQG
ncbi:MULTISPECIES: sigma-54-dependent Fis family transcriptional regulator [Halomonadaceae]|jgi:sigma-54 dependent transcriptional regulator, acetoin dehydrogenase operon transcriptional activator AcoR|uniref:sigma-54-dependent Fis family transcriptional regulator n=1 Tax=Halomonadaceae TaxID=28256 RepID=UPI0012F2D3B2|nr:MULTISPECIES: sigma-54-dependent Fis family transcriptional regulator [Halomonas]CAD5253746.1 Acetoin catabolism regulatory protein [Halomonas sp. I3]CAD5255121.1 Acetoin catabolism regulatory protein [Halomonas sp. 156]CAD5293932.1 Acetoin catabolism regulatory protein [Halomonas sp. 113]CAD5295294.1 Acetoin catabolism regulatory protein [Halomonas sp. 59]VXB81603.1 Acetoin catabolism regulatory protein [Halomonas titanicae]